MRRRGPACWAILGAIVAWSGVARAQSDADRLEARHLFDEGQEALERKEYKTAADRYRRGYALFHAPTLRLGLARAEVGLGHLVAAAEIYNKITREALPSDASAAFRQAVKEAEKELEELEARLPAAIITVAGADAPTVTLDGEILPKASLGVKRFVDPGQHTVRVLASDFAPAEAVFSATERDTERVRIELRRLTAIEREALAAKPEAPPSSTARTFALASFGVGAGGVVLGATAGALALVRRGDLSRACPGGRCPASEAGGLVGYDRMSALAISGLVVGGAALAEGTVLYLTTTPDSRAAAAIAGPLLLGVGLAGVTSGAATGFLTLAARSELSSACPAGRCPPSEKARLSDYHALGALTIAGLSAGAALTAAGAVLIAAAPKPAAAPPKTGLRLSPFVAPGGGGLRGDF